MLEEGLRNPELDLQEAARPEALNQALLKLLCFLRLEFEKLVYLEFEGRY